MNNLAASSSCFCEAEKTVVDPAGAEATALATLAKVEAAAGVVNLFYFGLHNSHRLFESVV